MIKNIVTWDLGATKCTAGLVEFNTSTQGLICKKSYSIKLAETTSLEDLIAKLEHGLDYKIHQADAVCIGAAGQYDGEYLRLEGVYPYEMPFAKIAAKQHWPAYDVIHDYAPIVCATFTSYMDDPKNILRLNDCSINPYGRRVALGIGTGLGMKDGVLLPNGDFWLGRNEMGHIGITSPPTSNPVHIARHREFIRFLRDHSYRHGNYPITFEKILSGMGVVRLYKFFYPSAPESTPEEVGLKMKEGNIPEMLDAFAWYAGLFVGTVQLSFMPEGGVWITGGVTLNNLHVFERPDFEAGIYASPAYPAQRKEYALGLMCNLEHALIGSGYYASKRLIPAQTTTLLQAKQL